MTGALTLTEAPVYEAFLKSKTMIHVDHGFTLDREAIHPMLFEFQRDIVAWAVRKGRAAVFADVGLGKTLISGEIARQINRSTLFVAPLFVVHQTIKELSRLGMDVRYARSQADVDLSVTLFWITNYDRIEKFDASQFDVVMLDESSILKQFRGTTKMMLCRMFKDTPFRYCFTATPAPNDLIEVGNHAEFLGIMSSRIMTASYFIHDSKSTIPGANKYRLKKHSVQKFYKWLSSWAVALKRPSDLGYSDDGYELPPLNIQVHTVDSAFTPKNMLTGFGSSTVSATEANRLRKATISDRAVIAQQLVNSSTEQWCIWTGLNGEDEALMPLVDNAVRVWGGLDPEQQVAGFAQWQSGEKRVLITKGSIAGAGVNMQFAHNMILFGVNFSWELFYQIIGRMQRFGQAYTVNVHVIISEQERGIYNVIEEKGREALAMTEQLIVASRLYMQEELQGRSALDFTYATAEAKSKSGRWELWLGDSCERMKEIADESVHMSIYSPPFGSTLFIYSPTERDLGNCTTNDQFMVHYKFIIAELLRVTMPGRLSCVHVQDVKLYENRDGVRGILPLSDMIIQAHLEAGWIFRSRVTIDKNPQLVATRNNDTDLLFVTGKRDSTDLAPMNSDYVLVFRKPGDNPIPVTPYAVNPETGRQEMTEQEWIRNAHAIWGGTLFGIKETNTLNTAVAKSSSDEKHICPLQLDLIEHFIRMWTNPGETVFSPFGGIGSEPYVAVKTRRRGFSIELNPNYFRVAQRNLRDAETKYAGRTMFDLLPEGKSS